MSSSYSIVFWFSLYTYIFISMTIFKFVMFSGTFCRFLWLIDWLGSCVIIQTRYTLSSIKLYSRNIRVVGFTFNNSTSGNQGCIIRLLTLDELQCTENVVFLTKIDIISIWRHARLYNQWRHMRILSIYA